MSAIVLLTAAEVEALVKRAIREAVQELEEPSPVPAEPTEVDLAKARKSLRRFGRGR